MMMIPTSLSFYEQYYVICGGIVGGIPHAGAAMGEITTEQIRCYDAFVNCNRASENMMHSFAFSECSQQAAHFVQQVSAFLKRKQLSSFVCSSWRVFGSSKKCGVVPHNPPTQPLFLIVCLALMSFM